MSSQPSSNIYRQKKQSEMPGESRKAEQQYLYRQKKQSEMPGESRKPSSNIYIGRRNKVRCQERAGKLTAISI